MDKRIILFMVALLVLTACAKPQSKATDNTQVTGNAADGASATDNPSNTNTATGNQNTQAPTASDETAIRSFFSNLEPNAEYKVTYNHRTSGATEATGTQTIVVKGSDFKMEFGESINAIATYYLSGKYYMCTSSDDVMCLEIPKAEANADSVTSQLDVRENSAKYKFTALPQKTIAGADTFCVKDTNNAEYCFSQEGIPLYEKITEGSTTSELIATEYTTTVSDSDLKLPKEPETIDIPGMN